MQFPQLLQNDGVKNYISHRMYCRVPLSAIADPAAVEIIQYPHSVLQSALVSYCRPERRKSHSAETGIAKFPQGNFQCVPIAYCTNSARYCNGLARYCRVSKSLLQWIVTIDAPNKREGRTI